MKWMNTGQQHKGSLNHMEPFATENFFPYFVFPFTLLEVFFQFSLEMDKFPYR